MLFGAFRINFAALDSEIGLVLPLYIRASGRSGDCSGEIVLVNETNQTK